MTDIEIDTIPHASSITNSINSDRSRTFSIADIRAVDFHTSISSVVPLIIDDDDDDDEVPLFSIRQIYKNLFILSIAFVLMFTAYSGISALQSSLNSKGNVGVNSLIITNAFVLFSSIFLTGVSMDIFGLKWSIIIGEIGYILYISANIRPGPSLMYISAVSVGLVAAPLWTAQATYISRLARYYAHHKQKQMEATVSLFFGIFFAIFYTSTIWGNLISYFVLNQSNHPQKFNCGIHFDPLAEVIIEESNDVSVTARYVLCGIFAGMGIISMLLLFFSLDQIRITKPQPVKKSLKKSVEVLQSLFRWRHIDQFFLVPLTMWTMIEHAFLIAQFTRAFVTCLVGIRFIGLVLIFNGICHSMSSYIFGGLVKYIGRMGCFMVAALINYAMIILMFFWEPDENQIVVLFIIGGLWGVAGAIWQSQVISTYTVLYSGNDSSAIAKYRLWKSIGSLLEYSYASYITIHLTLIFLLGFLTISMIFYTIVEIHIRWKNNRRKADVRDDHS